MTLQADPGRPGLPRSLVMLLAIAAVMITILGLRELSWLVGPVLLAVVIVLLVHLLHVRMRHRGVSEALALIGLLLAIYGVIIVRPISTEGI